MSFRKVFHFIVKRKMSKSVLKSSAASLPFHACRQPSRFVCSSQFDEDEEDEEEEDGAGADNSNSYSNSYGQSNGISNGDDNEADNYSKSRGRHGERKDSVTDDILAERQRHLVRIESIRVTDEQIEAMSSVGLGQKRVLNHAYAYIEKDYFNRGATTRKTNTGAGGFSHHLGSASAPDKSTGAWPIFQHLLPEFAFAGHSNSGKSTLVNALCGLPPRKGPAGISDRAGWTDQICFFRLGKKPPVLTLADLPGYGFAVATEMTKKHWDRMAKDYLSQRAWTVLSGCCILVDCTRGLCQHDKNLLRWFSRTVLESSQSRSSAAAYGLKTKSELEGSNNIEVLKVDYRYDDDVKEEEEKKKESRSERGSKRKGGEEGSSSSPSSSSSSSSSSISSSSISCPSFPVPIVRTIVVLTKADLLSAKQLAQCVAAVEDDLRGLGFNVECGADDEDDSKGDAGVYPIKIFPVSASTGAGVQQLWKALEKNAKEVSSSTGAAGAVLEEGDVTVREHVRAPFLRSQLLLSRALDTGGRTAHKGKLSAHALHLAKEPRLSNRVLRMGKLLR